MRCIKKSSKIRGERKYDYVMEQQKEVRINRIRSIGEIQEKGVKKKQIRREKLEETHWKGQVAGPKAARKRCIYFEKMGNDMYNNAGKHDGGERKH